MSRLQPVLDLILLFAAFTGCFVGSVCVCVGVYRPSCLCAHRRGEGLPHPAHPVGGQAALQPQCEQGGPGARPADAGV